jgi:RHS repeat-associated protein
VAANGSVVGARSAVASIDSANRLASLTVNGAVQGYGYDANGNLTLRGSQGFTFDIGNRLTSALGKAGYTYDGHGRRTYVAYTNGAWKVQVYGQAGKLLWSQHSSQGATRHVYLGDRLIAEASSAGVSYSHTDALGSPVARTNGSAQVTSRTRYEPYGATAAGTNPAGIGFTGHVNDADTGLVYMQQRYYEPIAGRFLSVDPVTTDAKTGGHFDRYVYAENNPYAFTDPDGEAPRDMLNTGGAGGTALGGGAGPHAGPPAGGARSAPVVAPTQGAGQAVNSRAAPISGTAQVTRSGGQETTHASTSARIANEAAKAPDAKSVHMNQTVNTVTKGEVNSKVRPDVATVRQDGRVDVTEVLSPGQTAAGAIAKNEKALGKLAGEIKAVLPDAK